MRISRRGAVDPFIVMDVMEAARAAESRGREIIHLEVGQPGTPAPRAARDVVARQLECDSMGYTVALGLPQLRGAIAELYRHWYKLEINPDRIIVTPGASGAFILAFAALFDANQRVGIGLPGYPSYRQILRAQNLEPVSIITEVATRFQPSPAQIEKQNLDGLLVASPVNPSGTMLDKAALSALVQSCQARNIAFISDEIYHGIDYEKKPISALEVSDDCVVINSFSKYFSMTGWRVGWMIVPESHIRQIERLAQNLYICTPHISQIAAEAALRCHDELLNNLAVYADNRQAMIQGLPQAGLGDFAPPDGAFYIYVNVAKWGMDSRDLSRDILDQVGVAVTPGLDFDPLRGQDYIRLSYAGTRADIEEGLGRLQNYFAARGGA